MNTPEVLPETSDIPRDRGGLDSEFLVIPLSIVGFIAGGILLVALIAAVGGAREFFFLAFIGGGFGGAIVGGAIVGGIFG